MATKQETQVNKSKIEDDIRDLEITEDKLLRILEIVQKVTKYISDRSLPNEVIKEQTRLLTVEYLKTVDEVCDSLRKHAELMENYHEAYRVDSLPLLERTTTQMAQTTKNAEDAVNIDLKRKK